MAKEIERKFLVVNDSYKAIGEKVYFHQGYLSVDPERTVRVRVQGEEAKLTIKGRSQNYSRDEFEYDIPREEAEYLLNHLCLKPTIEKYRYFCLHANKVWEVDEFLGENDGLIMAEIELQSETEFFEFPGWIGREVTGYKEYYNAYLVQQPFNKWKKNPTDDR